MATFATKLVSLVIEDSDNERIWVEWLRGSELRSGTCTKSSSNTVAIGMQDIKTSFIKR